MIGEQLVTWGATFGGWRVADTARIASETDAVGGTRREKLRCRAPKLLLGPCRPEAWYASRALSARRPAPAGQKVHRCSERRARGLRLAVADTVGSNLLTAECPDIGESVRVRVRYARKGGDGHE